MTFAASSLVHTNMYKLCCSAICCHLDFFPVENLTYAPQTWQADGPFSCTKLIQCPFCKKVFWCSRSHREVDKLHAPHECVPVPQCLPVPVGEGDQPWNRMFWYQRTTRNLLMATVQEWLRNVIDAAVFFLFRFADILLPFPSRDASFKVDFSFVFRQEVHNHGHSSVLWRTVDALAGFGSFMSFRCWEGYAIISLEYLKRLCFVEMARPLYKTSCEDQLLFDFLAVIFLSLSAFLSKMALGLGIQ